jgi:YD repeat-containing protein
LKLWPPSVYDTRHATLIYDEASALIKKPHGGSVISHGYNHDNRLIAVETKERGRIGFSYDAFGRRIAKETKDGAAWFLLDGDVLLAPKDGSYTIK